MNILTTVAYDGTEYCGWQRQKNGLSIQESIETALSKVYNRKVAVYGASRTDAGVHAKGQRAMFVLTEADINIPPEKIPYALNVVLPESIRIVNAQIVDDSFHPINKAVKKTYEYKIYNSNFHDPIHRLYSEHIYLPLNLTDMRAAALHMIGEHDFKAFCATGGSTKTTVRTVFSIDLFKQDDIITINITGNGFLYNMVRIIAGTLVYVGLGKLKPEDIPQIIQSCDRTRAGKTLSAKGLTLIEVFY